MHDRDDVAVVDSVTDVVARGRPVVERFEPDVDEKPLAVLALARTARRESRGARARAARPSRGDAPPLDRRRRRQRLDMRANVVHAEDRRAPIERGDGGADRRRIACRLVRRDRRAALPIVLLRESPTSTGRPSATIRIEAPDELQILVGGLAEADTGVEADELFGDPLPRPRTSSRSSRKAATSETTSSYAGAACIVRGSPCMCIRHRYAPASATTPASSGSPRSAVTSLTISAPSSMARACDLGLGGVDRQRPAGKTFEHGHHPAKLLVERYRVGPRPCRLAADVDDRRALVEQTLRTRRWQLLERHERRRRRTSPVSRSRHPSRPVAANVRREVVVSSGDAR